LKIINTDIYYQSRSNRFTLYNLVDFHLGHAACDEELIAETVDKIADDNHALVFCSGDILNCQGRGHPYYSGEEMLAGWARETSDVLLSEKNRASEFLTKIHEKILIWIPGNHEANAFRYHKRDIFRDLVYQVHGEQSGKKLVALTSARINLTFRRGTPSDNRDPWTLSIYIEHGDGGGRKPGAKIIRLGDAMAMLDADIFLRGHVHTLGIHTQAYPLRDGTFQHKLGVIQPSFLHSYVDGIPSYAEVKGYSPGIVGCVPIAVEPDKRRVSLDFSMILR
jgi:hypothetical protein